MKTLNIITITWTVLAILLVFIPMSKCVREVPFSIGNETLGVSGTRCVETINVYFWDEVFK